MSEEAFVPRKLQIFFQKQFYCQTPKQNSAFLPPCVHSCAFPKTSSHHSYDVFHPSNSFQTSQRMQLCCGKPASSRCPLKFLRFTLIDDFFLLIFFCYTPPQVFSSYFSFFLSLFPLACLYPYSSLPQHTTMSTLADMVPEPEPQGFVQVRQGLNQPRYTCSPRTALFG